MTARYYHCPLSAVTRRPLPQNNTAKELIGVANTLGRYLLLQSRMALNHAASATSYFEQAAESARIRGAIHRGAASHPVPNPTDASGEDGSSDLERRLRALEALMEKQAPEPEAAHPEPSLDPSALSALLSAVSGQNTAGSDSLSSLLPFLMHSTGQPGPGRAGNLMQSLLPLLTQAASFQSGTGGNPTRNAMLPLLIQAMGIPHR